MKQVKRILASALTISMALSMVTAPTKAADPPTLNSKGRILVTPDEGGAYHSRFNISDPGEETIDVDYINDLFATCALAFDNKKTNVEGPTRTWTEDHDSGYTTTNYVDNGNLTVEKTPDDAYSFMEDTGVLHFHLDSVDDYDSTGSNGVRYDRQRIEIKGNDYAFAKESGMNDGSATGVVAAQEDDIITYKWKFKLPEDCYMPPAGAFFHIFQLKCTQGAENSMPVFTFTVNDSELICQEVPVSAAGMAQNVVLGSVALDKVFGKWMEAEVTVLFRDDGYAHVTLTDLESNEKLVDHGEVVDSWRRPEASDAANRDYYETTLPTRANQRIRCKWGLYRKYVPNDYRPDPSGKEDGDTRDPNRGENQPDWDQVPACWKEADMLLGDIEVIRENRETYEFVDGYDISDLPEIPKRESPKVKGQNYALTAKGAAGKTVSSVDGQGVEALLDDTGDTILATDPTLVGSQNSDGGYKYWVALDLGEARAVDQFLVEFASTKGLLKNYTIYTAGDTADAAAAYGALKTSTTTLAEATKDPAADGAAVWKAVPGAAAAKVQSGQTDLYTMDTPMENVRYVLVRGDTASNLAADQTGAIKMAQLVVANSQDEPKPEMGQRVNWADPNNYEGVKIKASTQDSKNQCTNLLDGDDTTLWNTHSSQATEAGHKYWVAVDLGQARTVTDLRFLWDSTSNRIKDYQFFYSNTDKDFSSLTSINNPASNATADPTAVEGNGWKAATSKVTGVIANKTEAKITLDAPVQARYVLLTAEPTLNAGKGAIKAATFEIIYYNPIPLVKITAVEALKEISVPYATKFADLELPERVEVTLENGEKAQVNVEWDQEGYDRTQVGKQPLSGTLMVSGIYDPNGMGTVTLDVTVEPDKEVRDVLAVESLAGVNNVAKGTAEAQILANLPTQVEVTVTGDLKKTLDITGWTCPEGFQSDVDGVNRFEGTLALTDTVSNTQGLKAVVYVYVGMDEFDVLRQRWYYQIAGSNDFDENDPDIKNYVSALDITSDEILTHLVPAKDGGTQYEGFRDADAVFTDYVLTPDPNNKNDRTASSRVTLTYDRLKSLALSYRTKGSKYFEDNDIKTLILTAMDFMFQENKYSSETAFPGSKPNERSPFGNWYDWEIGTPLRYLDLLVLMYDDLTETQIENFTGAVNFYTPNPTDHNETGANKIWKCSVSAENAILMKNAEKLALVAPGVKTEMGYVTSGDGFYEDGSYIQHGSLPYTGGYGKAFIVTMAPMVAVLADTPYAIKYDDGAEKSFFNAVFDSYEPFLYNTAMMDMVRNREISRAGGQDHVAGRQVIRAIITLSSVMEGEQKERAKSMLKYLLQQDSKHYVFRDDDMRDFFLEYYVALPHILDGKAILEDASIKARGPLTGYYQFPSMSRAVQHRNDYAFGIAMCGWNANTYETTNNEGTEMWHTADGMLYLYNADQEKYADNFWGAVDHQRLPGTTVDRYDKASNFRANSKNGSDIVGGAKLGTDYGATAFEINNGVHTNKSYFLFDDEAVLLGSGITATSGNPVETIVENYKIKADKSNKITVDGVEVTADTDAAGKHENVKYAHVQGNVDGADVGYVFPGGAAVTAFKETRTQSWLLMNNYEKFKYEPDVTRSYATLFVDHGTDPTDAAYQYIILPGKSEAETAEYQAKPDVEILDNTNTVHAVRETKLGLTAANFFAAGSSEGAGITVDKPASVLYGKDERERLVVSVADPTNKATGTITVTLAFPVDETYTGDEAITVERGEDSTVLTVDVTGSRGQTQSVIFGEEKPVDPVDPVDPEKPSSGGSSGGSRGTESQRVSQPETADGVTAVTVTGTASVQNGTATVRYQEAALSQALSSALETARTSGTEANVTLEMKVGSPAKENKAVVPTASMKEMAQAGASLTVNTPDACLTWEAGELESMANQAAAKGSVSFTAAARKGEELEKEWRNLIQDRPTVELRAESGAAALSGGRVQVSIPYTLAEGEEAQHLVAWGFGEDGNLEAIACEYNEGKVSFQAPGLAKYTVGYFPFEDVAGESWYYTDAVYAYQNGLMNGTGEGFTPEGLTTRGMVVTMLWRLSGSPETTQVFFEDLDNESYCAKAVAWAVEQGVALGYGNGRFGPDEVVTREQLTVLLQNYARLQGEDVDASDRVSSFTDGVEVAPWAADAMNWSIEQGLVNGVGNDYLAPQGSAQRSQIAAIFRRMLERPNK